MTPCPIYCINLKDRTDRKEYSLNQFTKLNIPHDNVIYPEFKKDKRGGLYGCFDSHIKVWNDFFINHPNELYALVFEDDFECTNVSKHIMEESFDFVNKNYEEVDILNLHAARVSVKNKINNKLFTNGYGWLMHSYIITRHYIQSILSKHGSLPEATKHIDFQVNFNKDNCLYSNKVFYTNKDCFKQFVSKSDNYNYFLDSVIKTDDDDVYEKCKKKMLMLTILKKTKLINDEKIFKNLCLFYKLYENDIINDLGNFYIALFKN